MFVGKEFQTQKDDRGSVNIITIYSFSTRGPEFDAIVFDMGIAVDTVALEHDFL